MLNNFKYSFDINKQIDNIFIHKQIKKKLINNKRCKKKNVYNKITSINLSMCYYYPPTDDLTGCYINI